MEHVTCHIEDRSTVRHALWSVELRARRAGQAWIYASLDKTRMSEPELWFDNNGFMIGYTVFYPLQSTGT